MSIRSIERNATIAWSPLTGAESALLAAGTIAGSFDGDFNVHNQLEIIDTSAVNGTQMRVQAALETASGFTALAWSSASRPMGVVAGATVEGSVVLYDPARFNNPEEAVITTVVQHTAAATCLDFCPLHQNLIVTGSAAGELAVCDMNDPSKKTVYSFDAAKTAMAGAVPGLASGGGGKGTQHPITSVAWNRKTAPVLTAISSSGLITIWDLRRKCPILSLTDSSNVTAKWRSAAWDPSDATVLVTAADEDKNPVVLWDLRSCQMPRYFGGHTRGVWCTSWNPADPTLLVTSGKDRTLCWNPATFEVRCDVDNRAQLSSPTVQPAASPFGGLAAHEHWNSAALWSPTKPGTLAVCSFGAGTPRVSLVPMYDPSPAAPAAPLAAKAQQPAALQKVPEWMKRPVGCAFGFGGKIAVFRRQPTPGSSNAAQQEQKQPAVVEVHKCDVDTELVERAERFRGATMAGSMEELCKKKAEEAQSEEERALWSVFAAHYGTNIRAELLKFLNYDAQKINSELDDAISKTAEAQKQDEDKDKEETRAEEKEQDASEHKEQTQDEEGDKAEDIFGIAPVGATVFDSIGAQQQAPAPAAAAAETKEDEEKNEPLELTATGDDEMITRALLVGEYEKAAQFCVAVGRDADALVVASFGGRELFEKVRAAYCQRAWVPAGMRFVHMLLNSTLQALVTRVAVPHWKAAMAALCTYATKDEFPLLACVLGDRLRDAGNTAAATLCYIAAANLERVVAVWVAQQEASRAPLRESLPDLIEKLVVLKHATKTADDALSAQALTKFVEFAELLACQGAMLLAASYVSFLAAPRFANTPAAMFLDRLRRSGDAPVTAQPLPAATAGPVPSASASAGAAQSPAKATSATAQRQFIPQQPQMVSKPAVPAVAPASPFGMYKPVVPVPAVARTTPTASPVAAAPARYAVPVPAAVAQPVARPMMVPRPPMPVAAATTAAAAPMPVPVPMAVPTTTTTAAAAAPRPQLMTPAAMPVAAAPTFADAQAVAPSMSRPKPEKMTTSLASELQHAQPASAETVAAVTGLIRELLDALQQRTAGTADEAHVRDTAAKLGELLERAEELPKDCAVELELFLREVAHKDTASAAASLAKLTRNHTKALSAAALTGLRFLQRLAAKHL